MTFSAKTQAQSAIETNLLAALKAYPEAWTLTPVNGKAPYQKDWTKGTSRKTISQHITTGKADGVGIITGTISGGIVAIDCDGASAIALAKEQGYPETVSFTSGKPGRFQMLFTIPEVYWDALANRKVISTDKGEQLEIRWNNHQSVLPPSAHPETEGYRWINSPEDCPIAEAPSWVIEALLLFDDPEPEAPTPKPIKTTTITPDVFPLEICLSKRNRELLQDGVGEGTRNDSGIALALDLIGTANRLDQLGHRYDGDPRGMFDQFCDRCTPPLAQKERDNIWKLVQKRQAGPSLSDEALENCIKAWKKKQKQIIKELAQGDKQETILKVLDPKRSQADELVDIALEHKGLTLWHTPDEEAYADLLEDGIRQTFPLEGKNFRRWLTCKYLESNRKSPGSDALTQAINTLDAKAFLGEEREVWLRVAEHEDCIYIDLGSPTWEAVKISPDGWEVVKEPPVRFKRLRSQLPLPMPEKGGSLNTFREFFSFEDQGWIMVASWILYSFKVGAPYPICILHGPQGSGKSTLTTALKQLVDPSKAPLIKSLGDDRNFSIMASNTHLLAIDNLSSLSAEQSDLLCTVATGGGFRHRELNTNYDEIVLEYRRPVVLNGIDSVATRGDLLDRSMLVRVGKPEQRRQERAFWKEFNAAHPQMFGAICDALAIGLKNLPNVEIKDDTRMVDFAEFGTALEPALGLQDGDFMQFYLNTKQEAHETAIESSPLAQAIVTFLDINREGFEGTPSQLLERLNTLVGEAKTKERAWPKDATRLSKSLARLEPDLSAIGIDYKFSRTYKSRLVSLSYKKVASLASLASYPLPNGAFDHDARKNVASCSVMDSVIDPLATPPEHDARDLGHDAKENVASSLKPAPHNGYDANDANDAKKRHIQGGMAEFLQLSPGDRVTFIGSNHDYLDNGDVLEVKEVQGTIVVCDHSTRNLINIRVTIADLRPCDR